MFLGAFNVTTSYVGGFEVEPLRSAVDVGEDNYLYHIAEIPGQTSATPDVFVLGTFKGKEFRFDTKDAVTTTGQWVPCATARAAPWGGLTQNRAGFLGDAAPALESAAATTRNVFVARVNVFHSPPTVVWITSFAMGWLADSRCV